uniref:Uncharacterized protein n=1 Tax=Brassica campestris TaxID=3711 RepID=A0A3P6B8Y9_BRACM|nr:unnamed protein product [Brassica rapa]
MQRRSLRWLQERVRTTKQQALFLLVRAVLLSPLVGATPLRSNPR